MRCPSEIVALFPDAVYENQFGTVAVRRDGEHFEITTFRTDHDYADFRRPHRVEFGDIDRARPGAPRLHGQRDGLGRRGRARRPRSIDPYGGAARCRGPRPARRRRSGDPVRGGRAADDPRRPAGHDARVRASSRRRSPGSGTRPSWSPTCRASGSPPSSTSCSAAPRAVDRAPACWPRPGCSRRSPPTSRRSAASPRTRCPGEDLWDHTLRSVDASPADSAGRPAGRAAPRHRQAGDVRRRPLPRPRRGRCRAGRGVPRPVARARGRCAIGSSSSSATTCSATKPNWSDAAVRRFIGKLRRIRRRVPRGPARAARGGQRRIGTARRRRAARRAAGADRGRAGRRGRPGPERTRRSTAAT